MTLCNKFLSLINFFLGQSHILGGRVLNPEYPSLWEFFEIYLAPCFGNTYQEIVDSYLEYHDGFNHKFLNEVDNFLKLYHVNDSANPALEELCGDSMAFLRPSSVEFIAWLSAYLKQKHAK